MVGSPVVMGTGKHNFFSKHEKGYCSRMICRSLLAGYLMRLTIEELRLQAGFYR
jgi:hypothetical protein